jgi:hypothetical protein
MLQSVVVGRRASGTGRAGLPKEGLSFPRLVVELLLLLGRNAQGSAGVGLARLRSISFSLAVNLASRRFSSSSRLRNSASFVATYSSRFFTRSSRSLTASSLPEFASYVGVGGVGTAVEASVAADAVDVSGVCRLGVAEGLGLFGRDGVEPYLPYTGGSCSRSPILGRRR